MCILCCIGVPVSRCLLLSTKVKAYKAYNAHLFSTLGEEHLERWEEHRKCAKTWWAHPISVQLLFILIGWSSDKKRQITTRTSRRVHCYTRIWNLFEILPIPVVVLEVIAVNHNGTCWIVKETVGTIQVIKFFVIQKSRGRTRKKAEGASNQFKSSRSPFQPATRSTQSRHRRHRPTCDICVDAVVATTPTERAISSLKHTAYHTWSDMLKAMLEWNNFTHLCFVCQESFGVLMDGKTQACFKQ